MSAAYVVNVFPRRTDHSDFQFFLPDALGTVRDVVDDSGDVIKSYEFNEHGIPMVGSGAGSGTFSPKTYQGGLSVNDDRNDSGLYLMGHRHYAADLGRFISRDPIGFRGGLNLFNGAGTNPVTFVDPSGRQPHGREKRERIAAEQAQYREQVRLHRRGCNSNAWITEDQWGSILLALSIVAQNDNPPGSGGSRGGTIDTGSIYNAKDGIAPHAWEALGMNGAQTNPLTGNVFLPIDFIFRQPRHMQVPMLVSLLANEMSHHRDGGSESESSKCEAGVLKSWLDSRDKNSTNPQYTDVTDFIERQMNDALFQAMMYERRGQ